jgi:hypothetical protein
MDSDLIRWSSRFSLVGTHSIFTSFILLIYQIKWNLLSTCVDHWWDIGFFAYAMTPLFLQYRATESTMLGTNLVH